MQSIDRVGSCLQYIYGENSFSVPTRAFTVSPHYIVHTTCMLPLFSSARPAQCISSQAYRLSILSSNSISFCNEMYQGLAHPPATSTHSARHDPCFPSTSTMSVSHLHLQPTPFSLTASQESQYSSSSLRFFSSNVVFSRNGDRGIWRAGAFAGQC